MASRIATGPGIEEVEPCPCQDAPRAVFADALHVCYMYGPLTQFLIPPPQPCTRAKIHNPARAPGDGLAGVSLQSHRGVLP
jgi:hypothetical protein